MSKYESAIHNMRRNIKIVATIYMLIYIWEFLCLWLRLIRCLYERGVLCGYSAKSLASLWDYLAYLYEVIPRWFTKTSIDHWKHARPCHQKPRRPNPEPPNPLTVTRMCLRNVTRCFLRWDGTRARASCQISRKCRSFSHAASSRPEARIPNRIVSCERIDRLRAAINSYEYLILLNYIFSWRRKLIRFPVACQLIYRYEAKLHRSVLHANIDSKCW